MFSSDAPEHQDEDKPYCGANFCHQNTSSILIPPDESKVDLLSGILLGFAFLATILMALLVDPLTQYAS